MPRWVRETLLWVGGAAGAVCLLWTGVIMLSGLVPLVFMSGSMSPQINTGDLAFARTVPAAELREGDIVSVDVPGRARVTHRVVGIAGDGDTTQLTLKGDANAAPDAELYSVTEADRVIGVVPWAGYVLNIARTPVALLIGGALVAAALYAGFTRPREERPGRADDPGDDGPAGDDDGPLHDADPDHHDDPDHDPLKSPSLDASARDKARRSAGPATFLTLTMTVAMAATLGGLAPAPQPTMAAFSDTAAATTGTFAAGSVPTPIILRCTNTNSGTRATIYWNRVDSRYTYTVRTYVGTGPLLEMTTTVPAGAAGQEQSFTIAPYSIVSLGAKRATVQAVLPSTNWTSPESAAQTYNDISLVGIGQTACT